MVSSESYTILAAVCTSSAKRLRTIRRLGMHPSAGGARKVEADQLSETLFLAWLDG